MWTLHHSVTEDTGDTAVIEDIRDTEDTGDTAVTKDTEDTAVT